MFGKIFKKKRFTVPALYQLISPKEVNNRSSSEDHVLKDLSQLQILIKFVKPMDVFQSYFIYRNAEKKSFQHSDPTQKLSIATI